MGVLNNFKPIIAQPKATPSKDRSGKQVIIDKFHKEIERIKDCVASGVSYKSRSVEIHKPSDKTAVSIKFRIGATPVVIAQVPSNGTQVDVNTLAYSRTDFNKIKGASQEDKVISLLSSLIKELSEVSTYDLAFESAYQKAKSILSNARSSK